MTALRWWEISTGKIFRDLAGSKHITISDEDNRLEFDFNWNEANLYEITGYLDYVKVLEKHIPLKDILVELAEDDYPRFVFPDGKDVEFVLPVKVSGMFLSGMLTRMWPEKDFKDWETTEYNRR